MTANDDPSHLDRIEQQLKRLREPTVDISLEELKQQLSKLKEESIQRLEAQKAAKQRNSARTNYSADFYAWTQEQAKFIRAGQFHQLDLENLAEEIKSLGRQERRDLRNRLAVLVGHLLKWQFQPVGQSASWRVTIRAQRREIQRLLKENPSLKPYLGEAVTDSYDDALALALRETGLEQFPNECPYSVEQITDEAFLPG